MIRNIASFLELSNRQIPVCPMCEQSININDHVEQATAEGCVFLVHESCLDNMDKTVAKIAKIRESRIGRTKQAAKLFKKMLKESGQ